MGVQESNYRIVDVDAHFYENNKELVEYFDEPYRSEILDRDNPDYGVDKIMEGTTGDRYVGGRIMRNIEDYKQGGSMSTASVASIMDRIGLDAIIMIANSILFASGSISTDDYRAVQLTNAYVDFMLEQVVDPSQGIYTVIPTPYQDPDASVDLIDRVGDDAGIVAVCMVTGGAEPPLGNRKYDPIYQAAEEQDLPVIFHTGGSGLDDYHIKGYGKLIETHSLGFLVANISQLTSVVIQGVPEKFPDLDIVFQESGLGWVPTIMYRLDAEYMKRPSEAPLLERRPSDYIKEFYYGTQPLEENVQFLETVMKHIGPEQIMYASDYPHWDYDEPSVITDLPFLSNDEKAAILGGNAQEVFGV